MCGKQAMLAAVVGCALVLGCEKDEETPSGAPAPVPQATEASADEMKAKTEDASERVKDAAGEIGSAARKDAEGASDAIKKTADAAAEAAATSPAAADAVTKLKQVQDYIRDNKLELAETTLKQLEANKASLPAAVQTQVTNARTMLDVAKKRPAATQPSLPK